MKAARRSLFLSVLLISAAWLPPGATAAVYRCPGLDAQLAFQDRPCPEGRAIDARPVPALGGSLVGQMPLSEAQRRAALQAAAERGEPAVGMSEAQLEQALGRPSRIHVSNQGQGRREQRIFERNGRTYHVSTHEGRVTAIRNRAGTAAGSKPRPCPSPQDIRNLETSASSITLVAAERRQLRDQLQRLRECR